MAVIPDFKSTTFVDFAKQNVATGSTIYTDGLKSFDKLSQNSYHHVARAQPHRTELRKGAESTVPLVDRAIGNLQQWLIGTHHGVSRGQLQVYLDECLPTQQARQARCGVPDPSRARGCTQADGLRGHPRC